MHEIIQSAIETIALLIEAIGVLVIAAGCCWSLVRYIRDIAQPESDRDAAYGRLRQNLGMKILLGLEILVAADIIGTVVTEPTMESVLILAVIVLIRTFLSMSIEVELEGRFPWQQQPETAAQLAPRADKEPAGE